MLQKLSIKDVIDMPSGEVAIYDKKLPKRVVHLALGTQEGSYLEVGTQAQPHEGLAYMLPWLADANNIVDFHILEPAPFLGQVSKAGTLAALPNNSLYKGFPGNNARIKKVLAKHELSHGHPAFVVIAFWHAVARTSVLASAADRRVSSYSVLASALKYFSTGDAVPALDEFVKALIGPVNLNKLLRAGLCQTPAGNIGVGGKRKLAISAFYSGGLNVIKEISGNIYIITKKNIACSVKFFITNYLHISSIIILHTTKYVQPLYSIYKQLGNNYRKNIEGKSHGRQYSRA